MKIFSAFTFVAFALSYSASLAQQPSQLVIYYALYIIVALSIISFFTCIDFIIAYCRINKPYILLQGLVGKKLHDAAHLDQIQV